MDEKRRNVDLLIRSSLEKERTDNMERRWQRSVKLISGEHYLN